MRVAATGARRRQLDPGQECLEPVLKVFCVQPAKSVHSTYPLQPFPQGPTQAPGSSLLFALPPAPCNAHWPALTPAPACRTARRCGWRGRRCWRRRCARWAATHEKQSRSSRSVGGGKKKTALAVEGLTLLRPVLPGHACPLASGASATFAPTRTGSAWWLAAAGTRRPI